MGGAYEVTVETSAVRKYYSIAGQRVAMNDGDGLKYLLTDHLGSVVAVLSESGTLLSEQRYMPFGEVRTEIGTITQTDFSFTGQRSISMLSIMDYNARMYDPAIGRFIQPDSIVPQPSSPQAWNRYAYANNNPSRFTDPSGHKACERQDENGNCVSDGTPSSHPGGDSATPPDVGVEWLTGRGPRHHEFLEGDPFTELLQKHEHIEEVRETIAQKVSAGNYSPDAMDYDLGGLQGVPKYFRDYSTLLTFGETGNLAVTFLGSYNLDYSIKEVNRQTSTAQVLFHIENSTNLASLLHLPVLGYTPIWKSTIESVVDYYSPVSGPTSQVTQSFWWVETIYFK
jgi:RHS repeat-associated protein